MAIGLAAVLSIHANSYAPAQNTAAGSSQNPNSTQASPLAQGPILPSELLADIKDALIPTESGPSADISTPEATTTGQSAQLVR